MNTLNLIKSSNSKISQWCLAIALAIGVSADAVARVLQEHEKVQPITYATTAYPIEPGILLNPGVEKVEPINHATSAFPIDPNILQEASGEVTYHVSDPTIPKSPVISAYQDIGEYQLYGADFANYQQKQGTSNLEVGDTENQKLGCGVNTVGGLEMSPIFYTNKEYIRLDAMMDDLESYFSSSTRYTKGSLLLMDPDNSHEQRWKGLNEVVQNNQELQESGLKRIMDTEVGENKTLQAYVLDRVIFYMTKSNDAYNGSPELYEAENMKRFIRVVRGRMHHYNSTHGVDLNPEAEQYLRELERILEHNGKDTDKSKISRVSFYGVSWVAISSINVEGGHRVAGIDFNAGKMDAIGVDGHVLKIKIVDEEKIKVLKHLAKKEGIKDVESLVFYFYMDSHGGDTIITANRFCSLKTTGPQLSEVTKKQLLDELQNRDTPKGSTPEPGTIALLLGGLGAYRFSRRKSKKGNK